MVRLYEVSKNDLQECLEALKYVAEKKGQVIDEPMVELLMDIHTRVTKHVQNENESGPSETLSQITMIQNLLGEVKGK